LCKFGILSPAGTFVKPQPAPSRHHVARNRRTKFPPLERDTNSP
jgi:hypothetical protein